ncbi:hypothetical protein YC2023_075731 [Brassica napus]
MSEMLDIRGRCSLSGYEIRFLQRDCELHSSPMTEISSDFKPLSHISINKTNQNPSRFTLQSHQFNNLSS